MIALMLHMQEAQVNDVAEQGNTPAAVQSQVQRKLADLRRQAAQAASKSSEAKQKRRSLLADISSCTRETIIILPLSLGNDPRIPR